MIDPIRQLKEQVAKHAAIRYAMILGFVYLTIGLVTLGVVVVNIQTTANEVAAADRAEILKVAVDVRELARTVEDCVGENQNTPCRQRGAAQTSQAIGRIVQVTCDFARLNNFKVPPDCG